MRSITSLCCALMALSLFATPLKASEAVGPTHLGSLAVFLSQPHVQKSLNLSSAQKNEIAALRANLRTNARTLVKTTGKTAAEYSAADTKLTKMMKASNQKAYAVLDKSQQAQVLKLEGKTLGGSLLLSDAVQNKLQLTTAQKAQLVAIHGKTQASNSAIHSQYQGGQIGHFQKIARLRTARQKEASQLLKVLTPAQRAAFKKLTS